MRRPLWVGLLALVTLAAGPMDSEDLERNARLLARWKTDPEHYQRLQRDLRAFHQLPPEEQDRLRRLDRELHEEDPVVTARLLGVLDRYSQWLERLPEEQRQRVFAASNASERLAIIRELREQEWIQRLPKSIRESMAGLSEEQRKARLGQVHNEEERLRDEWLVSPNPRVPVLRPMKQQHFPLEVRTFVKSQLAPRLNSEEKSQLDQADGKWPELPRLILELSDKYMLPPLPSGKVVNFQTLPAEIQAQISVKGAKKKSLSKLQGYWPAYALLVAELLPPRDRPWPAMGASCLDELPEKSREFVKGQLLPRLSHSEKEALAKLEKRWPEYPRALLRLARARRQVIPEMSLPGPPEVWLLAQRMPSAREE